MHGLATCSARHRADHEFAIAVPRYRQCRHCFEGHTRMGPRPLHAGRGQPVARAGVEVKGFTHAKGETRPEWSAANAVRTLNIPIRGPFVLLFPDHEVLLE